MASLSSSPRLSRFIEGETFTCAPPSGAFFNDIISEMDQHESRRHKRPASSSHSSASANSSDAKKHKRSASHLFITLTSPKKEAVRKSVITLSPGAYESIAPASNQLLVSKNSSSSSDDDMEASGRKKKSGLMKARFRAVTVGNGKDAGSRSSTEKEFHG